MDYETKKLLRDAVYVINHITMGFKEADKIESLVGRRISPNNPEEMVRMFLPEYCRDLAEDIIHKIEVLIKQKRKILGGDDEL